MNLSNRRRHPLTRWPLAAARRYPTWRFELSRAVILVCCLLVMVYAFLGASRAEAAPNEVPLFTVHPATGETDVRDIVDAHPLFDILFCTRRGNVRDIVCAVKGVRAASGSLVSKRWTVEWVQMTYSTENQEVTA